MTEKSQPTPQPYATYPSGTYLYIKQNCFQHCLIFRWNTSVGLVQVGPNIGPNSISIICPQYQSLIQAKVDEDFDETSCCLVYIIVKKSISQVQKVQNSLDVTKFRIKIDFINVLIWKIKLKFLCVVVVNLAPFYSSG